MFQESPGKCLPPRLRALALGRKVSSVWISRCRHQAFEAQVRSLLRPEGEASLLALASVPGPAPATRSLCVCSLLPIHIPFRRVTQHNASSALGPTPDHPHGPEDRKTEDFTSAGEPVP